MRGVVVGLWLGFPLWALIFVALAWADSLPEPAAHQCLGHAAVHLQRLDFDRDDGDGQVLENHADDAGRDARA